MFFSQWSDAMLSNLLYCQGRVTGSGSTSDLEAEWKKLYPASLLTARLTSNIALSNKDTTRWIPLDTHPIFSQMPDDNIVKFK